MAGPYTGTWAAHSVTQVGYSGAAKWGTGINPIHSIPGEGPYLGQNSKVNAPPVTTPGGQETDTLDEDYAWQNTSNPDPYLPAYNVNPSELWGDNSETGTADRPSWGHEMADTDAPENAGGLPNPQYPGRIVTPMRGRVQNDTNNDYPSWGGSRKSKPGGSFIRAIRRGAGLITSARVLPGEDVAQGWTNKNKGIAADSRPADDSQVFMQTSMIQRYKVRAGSQREGSQSTFTAPIESRVTGQKLKTYTSDESSRHWDMQPYEQEDYIRRFLSRQAGTGYREWNLPNEMYVSPAIQREPAPDPQLGPIAGSDSIDPVYDFGTGYY